MSFSVASIVWLILLVAFIVAEAATATLVSIWFCAGAAAALLLSALVRKKDAKAAVPTNADRNVGQTAEVIAAVEPARPGRARLSGVDWAARCDVPLAEGQLAEVVAVEGTTLVLRPAGHTTRAV